MASLSIKSSALKLRDNINDCSNISLYKFLDPPNKGLTGLVSMPGSGNHWVLNLLRMATGIHTANIYTDPDPYFPYNVILNGSVLLIKDHMLDIEKFPKRPFLLTL